MTTPVEAAQTTTAILEGGALMLGAALFFVFVLAARAAFVAALRASAVWDPNRLVNRSTRPSVSISFCRPVKNGWHWLQISRCRSGFVDRVLNVFPQAHRTSTSKYFG